MTHQGGLADRRRPTRANHRQTTLGAWPRSRLEAIGGGFWKRPGGSQAIFGGIWVYLEGVFVAIEGVLLTAMSKDGPQKAQESERIKKHCE